MKIRCAWCKETIGTKPGGEKDDTTDGICDKCLAIYFPTINKCVKRFDVTIEDRYPGVRI